MLHFRNKWLVGSGLQNPEVHVDEDRLKFNAHGLGVAGSRDYSFEVEFYLPIDAKVCLIYTYCIPYCICIIIVFAYILFYHFFEICYVMFMRYLVEISRFLICLFCDTVHPVPLIGQTRVFFSWLSASTAFLILQNYVIVISSCYVYCVIYLKCPVWLNTDVWTEWLRNIYVSNHYKYTLY